MANEPPQVSLGDLFKLVVHEFSDALAMVKRDHPKVAVRSVKLNIGQLPAADDSPSPPALVLADRYPDIDKGWQLALELGDRPTASLKGIVQSLPGLHVVTALDLFSEYPLNAIKGIDSEWSRIFNQVEISRVRHLARLDEPLLHKLIDTNHSLLPREFRRKALLLERSIPALPDSPLQGQSLYQLLQLPTDQLHEQLGKQRVARSEVVAFSELLDILTVAIDSSLLREIRLAQLLDS